jgi:hypothetical protein
MRRKPPNIQVAEDAPQVLDSSSEDEDAAL